MNVGHMGGDADTDKGHILRWRRIWFGIQRSRSRRLRLRWNVGGGRSRSLFRRLACLVGWCCLRVAAPESAPCSLAPKRRPKRENGILMAALCLSKLMPN
jgi:hypothetical protein